MANLCLNNLAIAGSLFQKKSNSEKSLLEQAKFGDQGTDFGHIRCPLCGWRPQKSSRWFCTNCPYPENFSDGCGTAWNTFDTGGICPGCGHQWQWTACLQCWQWSPHEAWYEEKTGRNAHR